jgi:hypothetical protein
LWAQSTYATTIRDSKRSRERDFLQQVHDCVAQGGKILIPVFALGRAQVPAHAKPTQLPTNYQKKKKKTYQNTNLKKKNVVE